MHGSQRRNTQAEQHVDWTFLMRCIMQLEEYFDFLSPDDIRIKGHRIGIEMVLDAYLHRGMTAEEIQERFPTLTLEEVYATILYYLHNRQQVTEYMAGWIRYCDESEAEARRHPHPATQRLLAIKAELEAYPPEERSTMLRKVAAEYDARQAEVVRPKQEVA
jgi:uncharacterized protein (DUF433 family)